MLRLSNSVVMAQVAVGANAPVQTIYANNGGDGTLALDLSVTAGSPWLTASVQPVSPCSLFSAPGAPCFPIQFTFNTASLARGVYTAEVTVSASNAIDAPQTVTVTVTVGSGPPYVVDKYVAPGTNTSIQIFPNAGTPCTGYPAPLGPCLPGLRSTTQDGGQWLSVIVGSNNTLNLNWTAWIYLRPAATMPSGTYNGTVTISGTSDDHTIPVTMHVTTQPIAVPSTAQINLRLAQGGPAATAPFLPPVSLTNAGMGTLVVQTVTAQGAAVSAFNSGGVAVVTVDPGSLAPGIYTDGSVTIQCNAANCPLQIPVSLEVIPRGPPLLFYPGVADNATFAPSLGVAPGDVAVVPGEQLSFSAPVSAGGFPLPTNLGGASVLVNDVYAPLFYSSFGLIAFQVPSSTTSGSALVQVIRDGQASNVVTVDVKQVAPEIVVVTDAVYNLRDATHPTKAGETLILWCIGLGATIPAVPDGTPAPASPLALAMVVPQVGGFGFSTLTPSFAGLAPGEAGVYQVIVTVPAGAPKGTAYLTLQTGSVVTVLVPVAVE